MNKSIFLLFLILLSFSAFAQTDYIIMTKGDSLVGKVNMALPTKGHEEVFIKIGKKRRNIKAYQVRRLVTKGKEYHTVQLNDAYKFMLLEKEGYTSIYKFRSANSYEFSFLYLSKKTGQGLEVPNLTFKKLVGEFIADCPEVAEKVENRTYKKNDINKIVDEYNDCITSGEVYDYTVRQSKIEKSKELDLVKNILDKIKGQDNRSELITLLNDIKTKMDNGDSIPAYLKSALKDQTKGIDGIQSQVEELLKKL